MLRQEGWEGRTMNWELVVWGLLLGLAGMLWMMVLAVGSEKAPRPKEETPSMTPGKDSSSGRNARTPAA
jgi:hypothetical protein